MTVTRITLGFFAGNLTDSWDPQENHLDYLDEAATAERYGELCQEALQETYPDANVQIDWQLNTSGCIPRPYETAVWLDSDNDGSYDAGHDTPDHDVEWVDEITSRVYHDMGWIVYSDDPISIAIAADEWGLNRISLSQACREGRVRAQRFGGRSWFVSARAMDEALSAGRIRPRK